MSELCQNVNTHCLWPTDGSASWLPLKVPVSIGFTNTQERHRVLALLALGSKAESVWCGIFPWQMEPGVDFFFYLSLHTWLLVLWQRWEASLLLQITNFQCEYRFPGLTHQGFGELCERHAAVASPGGTVPSVSRKDVKLLSPPAMGLAPNPPYPTFTSLFSQGNAFLFVVNSSQGKASYKN